MAAAAVELRITDPDDPDAQRCVQAYFAELDLRSGTRYDPSAGVTANRDELVPPAGHFLVAHLDGEAIGCGGVKHPPGRPAEIKRMWVDGSVRGMGLGRRLLAVLEEMAAEAGAPSARLETNRALVEAIAMYRRAGYEEVAPFNDEPFAHHWFEKP